MLNTDGDIETYKWRVSPDCGGTKIGGDCGYCFMSWKAFSQSGVHSNYLRLRRSAKKGKDFSPNLERKRLIATIHPLSRWTTLIFIGDLRFWIAVILDGLIFNPHCEIMKPKNFPACTPKCICLDLVLNRRIVLSGKLWGGFRRYPMMILLD